MAKKVILKSKSGVLYYPQTVSQAVYDNESGKSVAEIVTELNNKVRGIQNSLVKVSATLNLVKTASFGGTQISTLKNGVDNQVYAAWKITLDNVEVPASNMKTFKLKEGSTVLSNVVYGNKTHNCGVKNKTGNKSTLTYTIEFETNDGFSGSATKTLTFVNPSYYGWLANLNGATVDANKILNALEKAEALYTSQSNTVTYSQAPGSCHWFYAVPAEYTDVTTVKDDATKLSLVLGEDYLKILGTIKINNIAMDVYYAKNAASGFKPKWIFS